jgi:predicted O-methyltransferase YrrM
MEELFEIKKDAVNRHIPIILDDTLDTIENYLSKRREEGIYVNKILEIGTAVGYSAICFTKFLEDGGVIDTIERDEKMQEEAEKNIEMINSEGNFKINLIKGDAFEILPTINPTSEEDKYDMIFIDANKGKYPFYLSESLRLMKKSGIIFADNVLYKGYVMSDYNLHKQRTAVTHLREFIKLSTENENLNTEILEIGDGLEIITYK